MILIPALLISALPISIISHFDLLVYLLLRCYSSVSNGSACNSSSYNPSHVLTAMGLNIEDIESSIRLSWGNNDNIITNLELLIQTAKKL